MHFQHTACCKRFIEKERERERERERDSANFLVISKASSSSSSTTSSGRFIAASFSAVAARALRVTFGSRPLEEFSSSCAAACFANSLWTLHSFRQLSINVGKLRRAGGVTHFNGSTEQPRTVPAMTTRYQKSCEDDASASIVTARRQTQII